MIASHLKWFCKITITNYWTISYNVTKMIQFCNKNDTIYNHVAFLSFNCSE